MSENSKNFKGVLSKFTSVLKRGLNSKFFPFFTAALLLISNYLGLDIFAIYYVCIAGILIMLLLNDVTPVISLFLMINVIISEKNSPSPRMDGGSEYYYNPVIYVQIGVLIGLWVLSMMYRVIIMSKDKKFKPTYVFYGLCGLAAAFLLNGLFGGNYDPRNLAYGAMMAFFFLFLFVVMKDNIKISEENYIKIAYDFFALSVLLLIELAVTYLTRNVLSGGVFARDQIVYGWGVCLQMGALLLFCIPAILYLAKKYEYGYLFTAYSLVILLGIVLSTAKQAILGAIIIYPLCLIPLFRSGKNRLLHLFVLCAAALIVVIVVASIWDKLWNMFSDLFSSFFNDDGSLNGSGRMTIWRMAIEDFKHGPAFGAGFFDNRSGMYDLDFMKVSGMQGIIPFFYQNTILQFLGSCGIFGLIAYLIHRAQTIVCFFSNVTEDRCFIGTILLAIIGLSLVDCHLFSLLPTMVYTSLTAILVASQKPLKHRHKLSQRQ